MLSKGAAVCASSTKNQDHLLSSSMIPSAGPLTVPLPESTLHNPSVSMVASAFPNIFSSKTTTPINVPIDCPPSIWSVTDQIGEQEFWTTWKQIQPPHCCICLDDTPGTESNRLLVCASPHCDVCVHQECYGEINSAEVWFCQKCLAGDHEARCKLCPLRAGAVKRTHDSSGWVHLVCAYWYPETQIGDLERTQLIDITGIPKWRYNKTCYLCSDPDDAVYGAFLKCDHLGCQRYFHATCAQKWDLLEDAQEETEVSPESCITVFCKDHSPVTAGEMNPWAAWVEMRTQFLRTQKQRNPFNDICLMQEIVDSVGPLMKPNLPMASLSESSMDQVNASLTSHRDILRNLIDTLLYHSNSQDQTYVDNIKSLLSGMVHSNGWDALTGVINSQEIHLLSAALNLAPPMSSSTFSLPHTTDNEPRSESDMLNSVGDKEELEDDDDEYEDDSDEAYIPLKRKTNTKAESTANSESSQRNKRKSTGSMGETSPSKLEPPKKSIRRHSGNTYSTRSLYKMYEAGDIPPPDDSDHSFGVATSAEPEERKAEPAEGNDDDDESGPDDESTSQCEPEDFERLFKPEAKIDWDAVAALTAEVVPKSHAAKATKQEPRFEGDLYTPLWVRGVGKAKEGLCRLCHPENNWFKIKISAFWYHLNFFHGVSSSTGRPFDPPEKERIGPKSKQREGFCGKCKKWISIGSPRNAVVNVPEIYWWKHAQKCHH